MYQIKIIVIYMIVLIVSYAVPSGFGASTVVPVSAFVPYQAPSIRYVDGPILFSGIARQQLNKEGVIRLKIRTYKPAGNGSDGTVYIKYRRKVSMTSNEANATGIYTVDFNTKLIKGCSDVGTTTEWKSEIISSLTSEEDRLVEFVITGEAPVAGQYEGRITFDVFYN